MECEATWKRRTWRKLHIGMDPDSKEIIVVELTSNALVREMGHMMELNFDKRLKAQEQKQSFRLLEVQLFMTIQRM